MNHQQKEGCTPDIWGGKCSSDQIPGLLDNWPTKSELKYQIWEYTNRIIFNSDPHQLPTIAELELLERARLFGPGGDLSLRRSGDHFQWWFVGPAIQTPPAAGHGIQLPELEAGVEFRCTERKALLWGEADTQASKPTWFDNRVAQAKLHYPVPAGWRRVQLVYDEFSRDGRVEFIWLRELEEWV